MDSEAKFYDLINAQEIMLYALRFSLNKAIVNIGSAFWMEEKIDLPLLEKAIYLSIMRNDSMRLRFVKINKTYKQYVSEEKPKKIEIIDLSLLSEEAIDEVFTKWSSIALKYKDSEAYDIKLVKGPFGKTIMYVKVNHVALDAWGLTVFGKDVMRVYGALQNGKAIPPQPKQFVPIIEKELLYKNSTRYYKDFEFWKEYYETMPTYSSVNKENVGKEYRSFSFFKVKGKMKKYTLEKEKVNIINEFSIKHRFSPQILFMVAAWCYFNMINHKDEVIINNVSGRRSSREIKEAAGMMINSLLLRLKASTQMTFTETCEAFVVEQLKVFRHGDFPYARTTAYIKEKHFKGKGTATIADFSLTYQLAKLELEEEGRFIGKCYSNGIQTVPVYLTIMDLSGNGELSFNFDYSKDFMSSEAIDDMYIVFLKAIDEGIKNPSSTLGEIIEKILKEEKKEIPLFLTEEAQVLSE